MKKLFFCLVLFTVPLFAQMDTDSTRSIVPRTTSKGMIGTPAKIWRAIRADSLVITYFPGILKSDSSTMPGYATRTMLLDTVKYVEKLDSVVVPSGYSTRGMLRDTAAALRAAIGSGGGGGGALVGVITATFSTSSTSPVDITGATVAVVANSTYSFTWQGKVGNGIIRLSVPSGTTMDGQYVKYKSNTSVTDMNAADETTTIESDGGSGARGIITGKIVTSSTAGDVKLQMRSNDGEPASAYSGTGIQLVKQ